MQSSKRRAISSLITNLLANAHRYSLWQAIAILKKHGYDNIKIATNKYLAFAPADIHKITLDHQQQITIYLNLFGLYGANGVLPHYFLELVAANTKSSAKLKQLLTAINQPLYQLLITAHNKLHTLSLESLYQKQKNSWQQLFAPNLLRLSCYQLQRVWQTALHLPVTIQHCLPSWINISFHLLGRDLKLGGNSCLGSQLLSTQKLLRLYIGPVALTTWQQWQQHDPSAILTTALPLTCQPQRFLLVTPPGKLCHLGHSHLGCNSWLGQIPHCLCAKNSGIMIRLYLA